MKNRTMFYALISLVTVAIAMFVINCGRDNSVNPSSQTAGVSLTTTNNSTSLAKLSKIKGVMDIQVKHTKKLMEQKGIVGTATGVDESSEPVILVYVKEEKDIGAVPTTLDNVPVVVEVTGEFKALGINATPRATKAPSGNTSVSHTAKQLPPIKLGTSGGWSYDLANGYCCGGTLGCLITDGVSKYILSNYHVFQSDITSGGNNRVATSTDPIVQPGLIDANCNSANTQTIAFLSPLSFPTSLPTSNVDASIAEVIPGMVSDSILEIGTISKTTLPATIGLAVKKSGRTTKLTKSTISGLNATINVTYENECAGGTAFTKTYTKQIVIKNNRSVFLNSGDSGSLLVEDKATNPRAIGLLYAGSNTSAIANPINEVLSHFGSGFTMVGK